MASFQSYYCGTDANKVAVVQLDATTGALQQVTLYPAATTNPHDDASKGYHRVPPSVTTEWMLAAAPSTTNQSPLLVFTSYGHVRSAVLSAFDISTTSKNGTFTKQWETGTNARQACHAAWAPNGSTLAVAHSSDAFVTFFQLDNASSSTSTSKDSPSPCFHLELPEVVPGTKCQLGTATKWLGRGSQSVPSCHCVTYSHEGHYLLCVDAHQSVIVTYPTDPSTGLPINNTTTPTSTFACATEAPVSGWVSKVVAGTGMRPTRAVLSPNGRYVFVAYDTRNVIQVYEIDPTTGEIDPHQRGCLQQVSTLSPQSSSGMTAQRVGHLLVHDEYLYVSNQAWAVMGRLGRGGGENSVRVWKIVDGGRLIHDHAVPCAGPVRHFVVTTTNHSTTTTTTTLVVGTCGTTHCGLQVFRKGVNDVEFQPVGPPAELGLNVLCVVPGSPSSSSSLLATSEETPQAAVTRVVEEPTANEGVAATHVEPVATEEHTPPEAATHASNQEPTTEEPTDVADGTKDEWTTQEPATTEEEPNDDDDDEV